MATEARIAIVGAGNIGSALSRLFARAGVEVGIANSRGPESLRSLTDTLGAGVRPVSLRQAIDSDIVFLAVPFSAIEDFGKSRPDWTGKIVVDMTNPHFTPGTADVLQGRLSARYTAEKLPGADIVKAFNQLPAATLAAELDPGTGRRVVFIASDSAEAGERVGEIAERLGLAPVQLGRIDEGGRLVEAPNALVLRNLVERPL